MDVSDKKKMEISKDVSAFANSAGGTILYGMSESSKEPRYAEQLSPIQPSRYPKEWLEQVINSRIHPRIQGIVINPVDLQTRYPGQFAYVVCIPESTTAHQASDHRYYKRYNFESVPMEDYEVRQTLNRSSRAAYHVKAVHFFQKSVRDDYCFFHLNCVVENVTEVVGRDVSAVLFLPKHIILNADHFEVSIGGGIYSRIPGNWISSASQEIRTAMDAHPLTPYQVSFLRELRVSLAITSGVPLKAVIRIYDRFGLAETVNVSIALPALEVLSIDHVPSPGSIRRSGMLSF